MLSMIDNNSIKENRDIQILKGKYKIPLTFIEAYKQKKLI